MRKSRRDSIAKNLIALDFETHAIQPGSLTPPLVCGSIGWLEDGPRVRGALLNKQDALKAFAEILENPDAVMCGANISFDIGVAVSEFAKLGFDAFPALFKMMEEGRIVDLLIVEQLHAIAAGHLGKDPRIDQGLKNPSGKAGSYSLETVVDLVLDRKNAKANDEWRLRYQELEDIPLEEWPQAARDYPIDDAVNSEECALAQFGVLPKVSPKHDFQDGACAWCLSTKMTGGCNVRRPHRNLHQVSEQTNSAICLHLGAAWGFSIDQTAVDKIEAHALRRRASLIDPFIEAGIIRDDGTEDRSKLKRMVAEAYGAKTPCPVCSGTGKVPSSVVKELRCTACKGRCKPWKAGGKIKEPTITCCEVCNNTGKIPHPNPTMVNCVIHPVLDDEGEVEVPASKTCDGTGLYLEDSIPRSDKDGISYGRDTLIESGDEFLMSYGFYLEDAKILKDYVPYLRQARVPVAGHDIECEHKHCTCPGPYREISMLLRPHPLLETGRVGYSGYIQLFPRKGGFRTTYEEVVEVPDDYVLQEGEEVVA